MLSFKVAVRFLKSGRAQTILIITGIAIAVSVQIFVGLLIDSLQKTLVDRTIGNSPHITIVSSADKNTIRGWENIIAEVEQTRSIKAISASASANAFVENGNDNLPVLLRGFDFQAADKIYKIEDSIYAGRPYQSQREVLIGKELREELELDIGNSLEIITPSGKRNTFTISGFYDLGVSNINKTWVITHIETVQKVFELRNRVTSIEITVNDLFEADTIASEIEQRLANSDIKLENWKEQNEQLLSGLEGQRISSAIIQAVVIFSVVIAISSVLAISVLQKSRQIGILKAMGIKDRAASFIFLYQGFLLGLLGSVLGILLGLSLLYAFDAFTSEPGGSALVDLYIDFNFILRSWLIILLASTLAGIIPARRSLKLNPIDVIREA